MALISSFCDTQLKKEILLKNLSILKSLGVDTLLISPLTLDESIINNCDFYFNTKENPILTWPQRIYDHWLITKDDSGKNIKLHRGLPDYGWAAMYQLKKLIQIGLSFEYDLYYPMIYDLNINDFVVNEINSNTQDIFYRRVDPKNNTNFWSATLHFMSLTRNKLEIIEKLITLDSYLQKSDFPEKHAETWAKNLNITLSENAVSDSIFYWENINFFNYSVDNDYCLFFNKNDDIFNKLCLFVYNVNKNCDIKISINNKIYNYSNFIQTDYNFNDVNNFEIIKNNISINYTKEYQNSIRNLIYYE